jgi:hypothetical protein
LGVLSVPPPGGPGEPGHTTDSELFL